MLVDKIKLNLKKQIKENTAPVRYSTLYYSWGATVQTHLYVADRKHFCGIKECPSNDK